ncbi:hypothetical protein A2311_05445 [candidate division WOR-1 bacterium RIFOXYB2_FULL_48_7]|uniref:Uncharacterized protein n=1 Tax=candidate division WOR-1 bacterium RIFOXYB2_FULL_48_7 TaxID=1802583 RepID=A0A1F4TJR6_UNCSA|nr:MAG: hypothetical protein A2311_05445 [candidate division WOR-1 bacterium RIFOXYB2_FULL_48_7]
MLRNLLSLTVLLAFVLFGPALATVGGEEEIEILGADPSGRSIYLIYQYYNEGPSMTELWHYSLPDRQLNKLTFRDEEENYSRDQLTNQLYKIKKHLRPLRPINPEQFPVVITLLASKEDNTFNYPIPYWEYQLSYDQGKSHLRLKNYWVKDVTIKSYWQTANGTSKLAIARFTGLPEEGGYKVDQALFLPAVKKIVVYPQKTREWFPVDP